jgi:general secretion pathway protein D
LIPHIVRGQELTEMNTKAIDIGTANYLDLRRVAKPAPNTTATPAVQTPPPPVSATPTVTPSSVPPSTGGTSLKFDPPALSPAKGATFTVKVSLNGAQDVFSAPMQISYDPNVLQFMGIANGDLLTKDGQAVALVHREDPGSVQASATRPPGSGGVNGDGVLYELTFQAKNPGQALIALRPMVRNSTMQVVPVPSAALNVTVH